VSDGQVGEMEENESTGVRPVTDRGEGWRTRPQPKRTSAEQKDKSEQNEEETSRRRAPLPFGKIDVTA